MQAADRVAGEEMRGEGELVDPGQDDVLSRLGDEHPEHRQDPRHPQLHRPYGSLEEKKSQYVCFYLKNRHGLRYV